LVRLAETNKFTPKGGVQKPMTPPTINIMPRCKGWTPIRDVRGKKIGVRIIIVANVSMKQPRKTSSPAMSNKITVGSDDSESMKLEILIGT
jgi:hypothetical protein